MWRLREGLPLCGVSRGVDPRLMAGGPLAGWTSCCRCCSCPRVLLTAQNGSHAGMSLLRAKKLNLDYESTCVSREVASTVTTWMSVEFGSLSQIALPVRLTTD